MALVFRSSTTSTCFSYFRLHPGHRKGLEDKAYLAMNSPVHGEPDGVRFTTVADCIHKL